jgi:hypothetical protein
MGPEMVFVGEKSFNPITLDVWLSSEAECVLYDDDERAHTEEIVNCQASKKANQIVLKMGASGKTYIAKFNKTSRPKNVSLNGKDVPHLASVQALDGAELGWYFDRSSLVYAKFNLSGKAGDLVLRW